MKIAIVAQQMRQPIPGGIGTYIRGLVQGLAEGREAGGKENAAHENAAHENSDPHIDLRFVASRSTETPDSLLSWGPVHASKFGRRSLVALWERKVVRAAEGSDVVHATSLAFPSLRSNSKSASSMFVHDVAWRTHPDMYPERGRAFHERALLRALASNMALVVPSLTTADALLAAGANFQRIHVVGEGADHLPLVQRSGDGEFLLAVSTQEPRKNLSRLVEAYARIRSQLPEPWPLYIVGPQGWSSRDGTRAVAHDAIDGVELLGSVSDRHLASLFSKARTFVYVPLVEGFGLPPAEAMRAGVPVVASAVPSVNSDTAYLVNPLDVADIARGLLETSTNDALRGALVVGGLAAASMQTWQLAASAHVAVWADLVSKSSQGLRS